MCLYPKKITNRKYVANDKNGGVIPTLPIIGYKTEKVLKRTELTEPQIINGIKYENIHKAIYEEQQVPIYDYRVLQVEVPCGRCKECCAKKAREWQCRLGEEIKEWKYMYFVTFTFSPKGLREILYKHHIEENNAAAAFALRHSLELYRKYNKKSYRHWFITELGHEGTERIHMHGIIFFNDPQEFEKIEKKKDGWMCKWKYWRYGHIFVGNYVNQRSVNYMVKYMNKIDTDHKTFVGQILASPGIGRAWIEKQELSGTALTYKYKPKATKDYYRLSNGTKIKLPKYYTNKFLNDEEREKKWQEFMDTGKITIAGNTYTEETPLITIENIIEKAQEVNKSLDFGDASKEWRKVPWNITKRMLQDQERKRQLELMEAKIKENNYKIAKKIQKNLEE